MLANEYKWSLAAIGELNVVDMIKFIQLIKTRNELKYKEKIAEYKMLLLIHNTENPQELYEKLDGIENDVDVEADEEIGDLDKLQNLRNQRSSYRR
jgi:vacuolar-type H+-ATPase subunit I/STV1